MMFWVARAGRVSRPAKRARHALHARVLAWLIVVGVIGCGQRVGLRHPMATAVPGLCETVRSVDVPPDGVVDDVTVHRLAPCDGGAGPVLLHLPGGNMNGELPRAVPEADLRAILARAGFVVWTLSYRTHQMPPDAAADRLVALSLWTADRFTDDAAAALAAVRSVDGGIPWVSGFSFGAGVAYRLAARGEALAGLIVLDGAPPDGRPAPTGESPAIDLAGGRLSWPDRERLLAATMRDPAGPSPLDGFATAGEALVAIVHGARAFGGDGGLSAVKDGATDVRALAGLRARSAATAGCPR